MRSSKRSLIMILISSISVMGSLLLKDVISVDMLRLHRETLLFVTSSHKIASAALFVIVYPLIVGLFLPGTAIASITGDVFFSVNVLAAISQVRFRNFVLKTGISILPGAIVFTSPCVGLESLFGKGVEMNLFLLWSPHLLLPFLGPLGLSLIPIFLNNKDEAE